MTIDLPLHPLFVHFPVVILPLTALGVIVFAWMRSTNPLARFLLVLFSIGGAVSAIAAVLAGQALAAERGISQEHAQWGSLLMWTSIVFAVMVTAWILLAKKTDGEATGTGRRLWATAMSIVAVVVMVLTVLAGHSGAEASWGSSEPTPTATEIASTGSDATDEAPDAADNDATQSEATNNTDTTTTEAVGYTMTDVAAHSDPTSCWTAINGNVYDLTGWIAQHPGGSGSIQRLCGTDATDAFTATHGGQVNPQTALDSFLLGPLSQ